MSAFDLKRSIEEISVELGTDPKFLEKDYYVSKLIQSISDCNSDMFRLVFGGGTSLLKAHKIINRFSEDIDFVVYSQFPEAYSRSQQRNARRIFRKDLINRIESTNDFTVDKKSQVVRDEGAFFQHYISFPPVFDNINALRPEIKLECTFIDAINTDQEIHEIIPLIDNYITTGVSCCISCVPMIETAADKLSALAWRVPTRIRDQDNDDPTIIRHAYDLYHILNTFPDTHRDIVTLYKHKFHQDYTTRADKVKISKNPAKALSKIFQIFKEDPIYQKEYDKFVLNMCFDQKQSPSLTEVNNVLIELVGYIVSR